MKQFIKALPLAGEGFKYLCTKFLVLVNTKVEKGVFVGPDVRQLVKNGKFENLLDDSEENAWISFKIMQVQEWPGGK